MKKIIKKIFTILFLLFVFAAFTEASYAEMRLGGFNTGITGINQGNLYSKSEFPLCVSNAINTSDTDLTKIKSGTSVLRNYLKLIEIGDAGINNAIKNGELNNVAFVTTRVHKISIPLGHLPLYYKETRTFVYGNQKEKL